MKTQSFPIRRTAFLATALFTSVVSAQNVGIGTTTPKSKLSVNGSTAAGGIAVGDAAYTSTTGTVAPLNSAMIQGSVLAGRTSQRQIYGSNAKFDASGGSAILDQGAATGVPGSVGYYFGSSIYGLEATLGATYETGNILTLKSPGAEVFIADSNGAVVPNASGARFVWGYNGFNVDDPNFEEVMRLQDGNLGVGDTTPVEAKLVVRGGVSGTGGAGKVFNSASVNLGNQAAFSPLISIYASNVIAAGSNLVADGSVIAASSLTPSDARLKDIIGLSDGAADLETLGKIRITDYTMKDASATGGRATKKVIAQQVEEVYPAAISKTSGYLPDIQAQGTVSAKGDGLFEIRMEAPHGLEVGAKVKLRLPNGEPEFATVRSVAGTAFSAKLEQAKDGDKVLVYGRQVNDLRTVDYDALSMLNISATQELTRKISALEAENAKLKERTDEVAELKSENLELKSQTGELAARLEAVEKSMAALGNGKATRTVALTEQ